MNMILANFMYATNKPKIFFSHFANVSINFKFFLIYFKNKEGKFLTPLDNLFQVPRLLNEGGKI